MSPEAQRLCPVCHSPVAAGAKKCRHCHNYLGFSFQWVWEEGVRVLGLLATVAAAVVAWKSLEFTVIAQRQKDEALALVAITQQEREALKEDVQAGPWSLDHLLSQPLTGQARSLSRAATGTSDLRVRQALDLAGRLQGQSIHFRMGGKSPDEGFDSSGFVSYLLGSVGALDPSYHGTFSVAKLERTFPKVKPDAAKTGDLVFLGDNFVAINLGQGRAVGIGGSKGIQVFTAAPRSKPSYRRWAYEQDAKMLR